MSIATFAAPVSKPRRARSVVDAVLAAAVDLARDAAVEAAGPDEVGEHLGARAEDQRLATHYFASTAPGYVGWRWAVTLARAPRARVGTVCEVSLLPGDGAITAPAWVPWSERLQPGDVGRHDLLPYVPDDERLEFGFEATGDEDVDQLAIVELGLGRVRVLSRLGREEAMTRWYNGDRGPVEPADRPSDRPSGRSGDRRTRAKKPLAQCSTCGFLMLMAGSMRTVFGVCSNEWSPDDGRVVSMDHGCGAHSETDVEPAPSDWPVNAPLIDSHGVDFHNHRAEAAAQVEPEPEVAASDVEAVVPESVVETALEEPAAVSDAPEAADEALPEPEPDGSTPEDASPEPETERAAQPDESPEPAPEPKPVPEPESPTDETEDSPDTL